MMFRLLILLTLFSGAALAADGVEDDRMTDIGPAEWRAMVQGRTVTYMIGEERWANERYDAAGNGVSIQLADGSCMDGFWYHADDVFCFAWSLTDTSCFRHVRQGDDILIIPTRDGVPTGTIQTVAGISNVPLNCSGDLTS